MFRDFDFVSPLRTSYLYDVSHSSMFKIRVETGGKSDAGEENYTSKETETGGKIGQVSSGLTKEESRDTASPTTLQFVTGNPRIEIIPGLLHLYRCNDPVPIPNSQTGVTTFIALTAEIKVL